MLAIEPEIVENYVRSGKVRLVFRDVLNHGERSQRASEAAACAGQQGYFWEMHGLLFESQNVVWATDSSDLVALMTRFGGSIEGLDQDSFSQCLNDRSPEEQLKAADSEQRSRGITSQPIFEIGSQRLFGSQSFETMSTVIEEALK